MEVNVQTQKQANQYKAVDAMKEMNRELCQRVTVQGLREE